MGSTTLETTTKFEFHDLGDTRGVIFNTATGEMEYEKIRIEPLPNPSISIEEVTVNWGQWSTLPIKITNLHELK